VVVVVGRVKGGGGGGRVWGWWWCLTTVISWTLLTPRTHPPLPPPPPTPLNSNNSDDFDSNRATLNRNIFVGHAECDSESRHFESHVCNSVAVLRMTHVLRSVHHGFVTVCVNSPRPIVAKIHAIR